MNDKKNSNGLITCRKLKINYNICQVACGSQHTLMLGKEGKVFSSGSNMVGQLGLRKRRVKKVTPLTRIEEFEKKRVVQISCGQNHCLALANGEDGVLI